MPAQENYDQETQDRAVRRYAGRFGEGDFSQWRSRMEVGGAGLAVLNVVSGAKSSFALN